MGSPAFNLFEEARDAIGILELLDRYGFPLRRVGSSWRSSRCPVCGQSPDPKSVRLAVFPESNRWYCHRCKTKGDVIQAVAEIEGISRYEAAREILSDTCGWHRVELRPVEELRKKEDERMEARRRIASILVEIAKKSPGSRKRGWDYLIKKRKIPETVVIRVLHRFLFFLPSFPQLAKAINTGVSKDLLREAQLVKEKVDPETGEVKEKNILLGVTARRPILLPFNFPEGEWGAELRAVDDACELKSYTLGPKGFWLLDRGPHLLVVEGFIDFLSALALGWRGGILGLPGVGDIKRVPVGWAKEKVVWLALDGDEAGRETTEWAVSQGLVNFVFEIPEGKDLNDLLREGRRSFGDLSYKQIKRRKS